MMPFFMGEEISSSEKFIGQFSRGRIGLHSNIEEQKHAGLTGDNRSTLRSQKFASGLAGELWPVSLSPLQARCFPR
jgi:hypothetical protein